ncbi:MAG: hypothetical protein RI885_462 [Actinomycetota bacterium]
MGLAAAIEARLAGFEVTVVEPRSGVVDKACGEGLMPGAVPLLDRLGVRPEGHPLTGVSYRAGSRSVDHVFSTGTGLGVRRTVLSAALRDRAIGLGVDIVTARVHGVEQDDAGVTLTLTGGIRSTHRAEWVLACDGLHSTMRRLVGLDVVDGRRRSQRRYGLRRHVRVEPWSSLIEVHWSRHSEIYITPVSSDTVGVALLGPRGADFDAEIARVPELAERLAGHDEASSLRGAGPFDQRSSARVAGRVLLVGDASGYVDAITGEGLRLGFGQATAAVAAIRRADAASYEPEWRRVTRDFRVLTSGLVLAATSTARAAIVPTAVALPRVFGAVVERLAR